MKKILMLLLCIICLVGCVPIKEMKLEEVVNTALTSKYELYNKVFQGYKLYLPRGLKTVIKDELNVIIKSRYYDYYLYVDLVSYYNKAEYEFKQDTTLYYSELIEKDDKKGIINISKKDDGNVLIKVSYYYATMEVKVKEEDINEAIMNIIVIVNSIDYQDEVIKSLLEDDVLSASEEKIEVFDNDSSELQELEVVDDTYIGEDADEYDPDVIN